jgi:hypothetical protein
MFTHRKLVNFCIFIVSILTVNIATEKVTDYLLRYKHYTHPAKATLIGMLLTAFVLYPAFRWIDDLSEKLTKKYFKAGKNAAGKTFGVILTFGLAMSLLFCLYLNSWFELNIWDLF